MNVDAHCVRQVVHMVTAARGAEEYYTVEHHATRLEGVGEARERDRLASEVPNIIYRNHKYFLYNNILVFRPGSATPTSTSSTTAPTSRRRSTG